METPAIPTSDNVWTVRKILQWTSDFLKSRGIESARLEAELLLAHARKCQRIRLYTDFENVVSNDERGVMREMVQRRSKREPLSYIIGEREFYGRPYHVGPGVLIPRPETESLVDVVLEHIEQDAASRIVEVGFGSGCIATTIAIQRRNCSIVATDLSDDAMNFATRNIARHHVEARVTLLKGDLLGPVVAAGIDQVDGVISNPPYIRDGDMAALQPEVAEYEPRDALLGGPDGLEVIRRLVADSVKVLRPGGFIVMEFDPPQADEIFRILESFEFLRCRVRQDLNRQDRIVQAVRA